MCSEISMFINGVILAVMCLFIIIIYVYNIIIL